MAVLSSAEHVARGESSLLSTTHCGVCALDLQSVQDPSSSMTVCITMDAQQLEEPLTGEADAEDPREQQLQHRERWRGQEQPQSKLGPQQQQERRQQVSRYSALPTVGIPPAKEGRPKTSLPEGQISPSTETVSAGGVTTKGSLALVSLPLSASSSKALTSNVSFQNSEGYPAATLTLVSEEHLSSPFVANAGAGEARGGSSTATINRNGRRRWRCGWPAAMGKVSCGVMQYVEHLKARILDTLMHGFEKYGLLVYRYSWIVLIASLLLTAALSVGVFQRKKMRDVYKLYSLKVSPSQKSKDKIFSASPPDRVVQLILESTKGDLLHQHALQQLANLRATLQNLTLQRDTVTVDEYNHKLDRKFDASKYPAILTYHDLCAADAQGQCSGSSVLDLYPDPGAYGRMPLVLQSGDNPVIRNTSTGRILRIDSVLAQYKLQTVAPGQPQQQVVHAHVAMLRMSLRGDLEWRPYVAAFERLITDYVLEHREPKTGIFLTPRTDRSASDELDRASTLDIPHWMMLVGAGFLVTIYTSVVNSSCTYRTKLVPSAMGALASLLGYLGGAGLVYLCGVRHTPPADATPFLALGIGVDDLFVIINSYSLTYLYKDPQRRVVSALRDAGLSITLTTLTNVITFMIGAVCPYYSISAFCLVTAGALCWGYVMCLTFFFAVLCIDARREARKEPLLRALLFLKTPSPKDRQTLTAVTQIVAPSGVVVVAAPEQQEKGKEAEPTSHDELAGAASAQQEALKRIDDIEGIPAAAAENATPVGDAGLIELTKAAGVANREETTVVAAGRFPGKLHEGFEAGRTMDVESSPMARYGEEILTTHELAALMVLYQKRKRLRAARSTSLPAEGQRAETRKEGSSHVDCLLRDVQSSSTACEVTPQASSGSRERELVGDDVQGTSKRKENTIADAGRDRPSDSTKPLEFSCQKERRSQSEGGGVIKKAFKSSLPEQSVGWETANDNVQSEQDSSFSRPTAEETARLLRSFQEQLEAHPERLLCLYHPEPRGNPGRIWRLFFREYYARLLGSTWAKLLILSGFLCLTGVFIYGTTRLEYGFSLKDITPNASFLRDFYEKQETYFSQYGDEIVVFFPRTAPLERRSAQQEYRATVTQIQRTTDITAVSDGLSLFLQNGRNQLVDGDRTQFLFALRRWLREDLVGRNFERDFQFSAEGDLQGVKFTCWMRLLDNTTVRYDVLQQLRRIVETAGPQLQGDVYSALAVIWESDPHILSFTLTNLAVALAAILGVSLLLIPNLASAALVVAAVTLVDVFLFGMMGLIHLHLSMISMVNLLISVGYSVDFTIHVAHTFTHCVGCSLQDRISETMLVMGAPVTHGMISTVLAIMALSGSPRYILQVFFKMMLMVVTFSYAAGMILLPTVLSVVGPTHRHRRTKLLPSKKSAVLPQLRLQ